MSSSDVVADVLVVLVVDLFACIEMVLATESKSFSADFAMTCSGVEVIDVVLELLAAPLVGKCVIDPNIIGDCPSGTPELDVA